MTLGQIAYEAHLRYCEEHALISASATVLTWQELTFETQQAWEAAAAAIRNRAFVDFSL
jgi:hypothetical protein